MDKLKEKMIGHSAKIKTQMEMLPLLSTEGKIPISSVESMLKNLLDSSLELEKQMETNTNFRSSTPIMGPGYYTGYYPSPLPSPTSSIRKSYDPWGLSCDRRCDDSNDSETESNSSISTIQIEDCSNDRFEFNGISSSFSPVPLNENSSSTVPQIGMKSESPSSGSSIKEKKDKELKENVKSSSLLEISSPPPSTTTRGKSTIIVTTPGNSPHSHTAFTTITTTTPTLKSANLIEMNSGLRLLTPAVETQQQQLSIISSASQLLPPPSLISTRRKQRIIPREPFIISSTSTSGSSSNNNNNNNTKSNMVVSSVKKNNNTNNRESSTLSMSRNSSSKDINEKGQRKRKETFSTTTCETSASSSSSSSSTNSNKKNKTETEEFDLSGDSAVEQIDEIDLTQELAEDGSEIFLLPENFQDLLDDASSRSSSISIPQVLMLDNEKGKEKRTLMNAHKNEQRGLNVSDYNVCTPYLVPYDPADPDIVLTYNVITLSVIIFDGRVVFMINCHVHSTTTKSCLNTSRNICATPRVIRFMFGGLATVLMCEEFSYEILFVHPEIPLTRAKYWIRQGALLKVAEHFAGTRVNRMAPPPSHMPLHDQVAPMILECLGRASKRQEVQDVITRQLKAKEAEIERAPSEKLKKAIRERFLLFGELGNKKTRTINVGRMDGKRGGPSKNTTMEHIKYTKTVNVGVNQHISQQTGQMVKYETDKDGKRTCPKCKAIYESTDAVYKHLSKCGKNEALLESLLSTDSANYEVVISNREERITEEENEVQRKNQEKAKEVQRKNEEQAKENRRKNEEKAKENERKNEEKEEENERKNEELVANLKKLNQNLCIFCKDRYHTTLSRHMLSQHGISLVVYKKTLLQKIIDLS